MKILIVLTLIGVGICVSYFLYKFIKMQKREYDAIMQELDYEEPDDYGFDDPADDFIMTDRKLRGEL